MTSITVKSYAGSKAEEYPLCFYLQGAKIEIIRIEDAWLTPGGRCFKVMGDNECIYVIEYDVVKDSWNLLTTDSPSGKK